MGGDACGWEGNCRSGITLATCQTLVVLHLQAQGLGEGDEHLSMLSCGAWLTLPSLDTGCWFVGGDDLTRALHDLYITVQ